MADTEIVEDIKKQIRLDKKQIKYGKYNVLQTQDPRAQYLCGSKGDTDFITLNEEFTPLERVDYGIGVEAEPEAELPETRKDLSFLNVKTIEEGIEWYRKLDNKIPEELLPIMARWQWGDLSKITKKQVKNENKKLKKKKKKEDKRGIKIRNSTKENPVIISFD